MTTDAENAASERLEDLLLSLLEEVAPKMQPLFELLRELFDASPARMTAALALALVKIERDLRHLGLPAPEVGFIALVEYLRAGERQHDEEHGQ